MQDLRGKRDESSFLPGSEMVVNHAAGKPLIFPEKVPDLAIHKDGHNQEEDVKSSDVQENISGCDHFLPLNRTLLNRSTKLSFGSILSLS